MNWLNISYDEAHNRKAHQLKHGFDDQMQRRFLELKKKFYDEYRMSKLKNFDPKPLTVKKPKPQGEEISFFNDLKSFKNNSPFENGPRKRGGLLDKSIDKKVENSFNVTRSKDESPFEASPRIQAQPKQLKAKQIAQLPSIMPKREGRNPAPQRREYVHYSVDYGTISVNYQNKSPKLHRLTKFERHRDNQHDSHRTLTSNNSNFERSDPESPVNCKPIIRNGDPKLRQIVEKNLLRASLEISRVKKKFSQQRNLNYLFAN